SDAGIRGRLPCGGASGAFALPGADRGVRDRPGRGLPDGDLRHLPVAPARAGGDLVTQQPAALERQAAYEVTVAQLAWLGAGTLFIVLRLAGAFSISVGGAELDHLSGAWQAHAGNEDARF